MARKPKVLVVDDDEFILKVAKGMLDKAGFAVSTASNTIGAGYQLKDFAPDLVVLDIMLPGSLSGDQACEALRSLCPGVKIVFFSGIDDQELKRLATKHQADACLSKGGRLSQLVDVVSRLLKEQA